MEKKKGKLRLVVEFILIFVLALTFIILGNRFCAYDTTGGDVQAESAKVKKLLDAHDAKYFVNESKNL